MNAHTGQGNDPPGSPSTMLRRIAPSSRRRRMLLLAVGALAAIAAVVVVVRRDSNTYRWPWDAVEALPGNGLRVEYGRPSPRDRCERPTIRRH